MERPPPEENSFLENGSQAKVLLVRTRDMPPGRKWQKFKQGFWPVVKKPLPYIILLLYSLLGGWVFYSIENPSMVSERMDQLNKEQKIKGETMMEIYDYLFFQFNGTQVPPEWLSEVLQDYGEKLGVLQPKEVASWDFLASLVFAGTVYTTIGFGHMAPVTPLGRMITVLYSLIGIPLALYCMANLGNLFCVTIWKIYTLCTIHLGRLFKCCEVKPHKIGDFPLWLAAVITLGWVMLCSAIFSYYERWTIAKSAYFFFQSLTTIGFGDVVPRKSGLLVASFALILVGIALVSMCWNLVQLKLEALSNELVEKIQRSLVEDEAQDASEDKAVQNIRRMASNRSWLGPLLGQSRTNTLIREWQRKAQFINKGVQAAVLVKSTEAQTANVIEEMGTQTERSALGVVPFRPQIPYRERRRFNSEGQVDEVLVSLRNLHVMLDDCREIMRP